jgi:hypothetical protein
MDLTGDMKNHLQLIINKINNGEYFGLIRPSDGEFLILENKTFTNCDNWTFNTGGILREQLLESIQINNPKLYIGIPCNSCNHNPSNIYNDYLYKYFVQKKQLTYANIFCNINWNLFINFLKSYTKGFFLITCGTKKSDFPIKQRFIIDKFLVNNWDNLWEKNTNEILDFVKDKKGELICFSAGPISKIWIPKCMKINPDNIYLDIGSVLDYYTKGTEYARPYTNKSTQYSREFCSFIN